jgi:hypothetical protein
MSVFPLLPACDIELRQARSSARGERARGFEKKLNNRIEDEFEDEDD